jgi:hypothetical protein
LNRAVRMDGRNSQDICELDLREGQFEGRRRQRRNPGQSIMDRDEKGGEPLCSAGPSDRHQPVHEPDALLLRHEEHRCSKPRRAQEQFAEAVRGDDVNARLVESDEGFSGMGQGEACRAKDVTGQVNLDDLAASVRRLEATRDPTLDQEIDMIRGIALGPDDAVSAVLASVDGEPGEGLGFRPVQPDEIVQAMERQRLHDPDVY